VGYLTKVNLISIDLDHLADILLLAGK